MPFWYANIFLEPQWATFELLFSGTKEVDAMAHFEGFLTQALPIILGARRFWSDTDVFTAASTLAYLLYGGASLVLLAGVVRGRMTEGDISAGSERSREQRIGVFFLLLFVAATAFIFSRSSFGWLSRAPRYLLPLYSVLPVLIAVAISRLFSSESRWGTVLGSSMLVAVLALNLSSNYLGGIATPGQPSVFRGQRVADSHSELYQWLADRGYQHIGANYWIGYRAAFETNEKLTFTRIGRPRSLRIPSYEQASSPQALVFVPAEAALYERQLRQFGFSFARSRVGEYIVLDKIERSVALGEDIPRDRFEVRTSVQSALIENMFDDNRESRWGSGAPQTPLMAVELEFMTSEVVAGVTMDLGRFVHDAPRRLRVEGRSAGGEWREIADFSETKIFFDLREGEFAEIPAIWQLSFEPQQLKGLRLLQLEATSVFDWSLAELSIHAPVNEDQKEKEEESR